MSTDRALHGLAAALARRFEAVVLVGGPMRVSDAQERRLLRRAGPRPEALTGALAELWQQGVHPCDVVVVDDGTGPEGRPAEVLRRAGSATVAVAGAGPDPAARLVPLPPAPEGVRALLADQVQRRAELPSAPADPSWTLRVEGLDPELEHAHETLLAVADGRVGIVGAPVSAHPGARPSTVVAGVYDGEGPSTHLLSAPLALQLPYSLDEQPTLVRVLDLRAGLLHERETTTCGELAAVRFSCLARPGTAVLRAACPDAAPAVALTAPAGADAPESGVDRGVPWMRIGSSTGGVTVACRTTAPGGGELQDRVVAHVPDRAGLAQVRRATATADDGAKIGFERLLDEQRRHWAARWEDADITLVGEADLQQAVRVMLFHLMGSVADRGEAAVGARGLTGHGYGGHVFWDADTFVLPFLAATHPPAARAMLEYRIRRLSRAMEAARAAGGSGARFPWESAGTGDDVTPTSAFDRAGRPVVIRTGQEEEHIVAEVAWATRTYTDWSGDLAFAAGPGLRLLTETARWWASRIETGDDGRGHIRGVIGPDEYHEHVDDNAFTNVMARWNLRSAADAVEAARGAGSVATPREVARWRKLAADLVDGYDPETGRHEQFSGFSDLEPLVIAEVAPRRPIAADVLMGHDRLQAAQVVKQADVLMLHHLLPDEVPPGSLACDLAYYEPRTAHGSSLSPGVHAALLARAGRLPRALDALRLAARMDLDDLTRSTAGGIHLATAGSLWQALVMGFAGVRPGRDHLVVDPHVPPSWELLEIRLRYRGSRVRITCREGHVDVLADPPARVLVSDEPAIASLHGLRTPQHHSGRDAP